MISITGKIWKQQKVNKNLIEKVKQQHGYGNILSQLIISRNYDISEIYGINNYQKLTNIFKDDNDFEKASLILLNSINNKLSSLLFRLSLKSPSNISCNSYVCDNIWTQLFKKHVLPKLPNPVKPRPSYLFIYISNIQIFKLVIYYII